MAEERALLEVEKAKVEHEQLKTEAKVAEEALHELEIVAPFTGRLVKVHKQGGEFVKEGDEIAEIINIDLVKLQGYVPIDDARRLRPGAKVSALVKRADGSIKTMFGSLTFVDIRVELVTESCRVLAVFRNADHYLRPGLRQTMTVHLAEPPRE